MEKYYADILGIVRELAPYGINVVLKNDSDYPNDLVVIVPDATELKKGNAYIKAEQAEKLSNKVIEKVMKASLKNYRVEFIHVDDSVWNENKRVEVLEILNR